MNVNDMYRICQFAINKAQNGYLTPAEFNLVINQAQISYQDKNAPDIVWAYTTVSGRPVYAPTQTGAGVTPTTGTVQPVWDDVDLLEIITRALKLIGLNLKDGMVQQYANQITQTGQ